MISKKQKTKKQLPSFFPFVDSLKATAVPSNSKERKKGPTLGAVKLHIHPFTGVMELSELSFPFG